MSSGGRLDSVGNARCVRSNSTPYYYIYWPAEQRIRAGTYEIDVWFQDNCNDLTPVNAVLKVNVGDNPVIIDNFTPFPQEHYITSFTIEPDGTVIRGEGGIVNNSQKIDYLSDLVSATALTDGLSLSGEISNENPFILYTFEGNLNDLVTIQMNSTGGTLDPLLFLVNPSGVELSINDDIDNENINALIEDFRLSQEGQYIVIATRYGTVYGGTSGFYSLSFSVD